ncbi:MAG: tetratricopeptide repeat protein, partial [Gammaproteobacteria bacterium]
MELIFEKTLKKGIKAHKSGQVQEAVRLYSALLESQPDHPEVNHSMGLLAVKMEDALRFFKVALESDPSVDQFWLSYINTLIKFDRITDAKAMFARAKEKGISGEAFDMMGQKLFTNNKTDLLKKRALQSFKSNILDTVKLDKALRLASKNKKNDQIEEAKDIYQDILKKFPKHKQALAALKLLSGGTAPVLQDPPPNELNSLINLYNQGQLKLALLHTSQLLESYPHSVILYNLSGASNAGLMQFDAAIKSYKQALKIKPDYVDALNNMGAAQNSQGDLEAAIQSYKSAIKIKPDYAEAHNNMGNALNSRGDQVEAIKSYAQAIKANPAYVDAHNNMGLVQKDRSNFKLAIKSFNQAIKIKPDYVEAYNNMGTTLQDKG